MVSLIAISRAASNRAKLLLQRRLWCHGGTFVLSIVAMFVREPHVQLPLIGALVTEVGAWVLRYRALEHHALGEEARRLAMAMNGFGEARESPQVIDLRAKTNASLLKAAGSLKSPDYYASTAVPGRKRLAELLEESSFWSKHLYRAAAVESFILSGLVLLGLLIVGLSAAPFATASTLLVASRVTAMFLSVLVTVDQLGAALSWQRAAEAASCVSAQLERIDTGEEPLLLTLFADYSVAAATAAPIPQHIYERNQTRLNELWSRRKALGS
jgi:hypothetical protein